MKPIAINTHIDCPNNSKCSVRYILKATARSLESVLLEHFLLELIMDIRHTLMYLRTPIGSKSFLFGDNRSVVSSATLLHSTLTKHHNILVFDRVREVIAAKLMAFYWIQSAYNLNDMLSKHWDHPSSYWLQEERLL